jgi:hypothetical protein
MTISSALDQLISRSPFLEEALSEGLINISSLARKLQPEVERLTHKKVQESTLIMAIHRRPPGPWKVSMGIRNFINELGDIVVRSQLSDHTFSNSGNLNKCQLQLMQEIQGEKEVFFTISQGIYETTIVGSSILDERINNLFRDEKLISRKTGLSSVTIRLPRNNTEISGIYYFILKNLAWAGINVCEIISTSNEISIIVSESDIPRAFPILLNLTMQS